MTRVPASGDVETTRASQPGSGGEEPARAAVPADHGEAATQAPAATLMGEMHRIMRLRRYSPRTEEAYRVWIRAYIRFHGRRHPRELGNREIAAFLSHLAVRKNVSASTQNQALAALVFLYREVLGIPVGVGAELQRAKRPHRVPVVLSRNEVRSILNELEGARWLQVSLLYGSGLRLRECIGLRVKDVDFDRCEITIRGGKGGRDRQTMLPESLRRQLATHLAAVERVHQRDLELRRASRPTRRARA